MITITYLGGKIMKEHIITNENGNIKIDKNVIAKYAGNIVVKCSGIIEMAVSDMHDRLGRLFKKNDLSNGIRVDFVDDKIVLDVHVIASYGVNLLAVTENIVSDVKYYVEKYTGLEVSKVNVYVDGLHRID